MMQDWKHRYWFLGIELASCAPPGGNAIEKIEACLRVAHKNWMDFRDSMKGYVFESSEDEIIFFKVVKPLFVSELEYYRLLQHAAKCGLPAEDALRRLETFKMEQAPFYDYYKSNRNHNDQEWFSRQNELESSHDHLVTMLLALEKYFRYYENGKI